MVGIEGVVAILTHATQILPLLVEYIHINKLHRCHDHTFNFMCMEAICYTLARVLAEITPSKLIK